MAAPKRPTHVVTHASLYLMVGGKLQHVTEGTKLTLSEKQSAGMVAKEFVAAIKGGKTIDLDDSTDDK